MTQAFNLPQAVAAYVPSHVVCRALTDSPPQPGEVERIEAGVLFADVAGFTTLTEQMVRMVSDHAPHEGHRGSEELNHLLNQAFTALMQPVVQAGGIVTCFGGDAITAYFERPPGTESGAVVACMLSCAQTMQETIQPFQHAQVAGQLFPISVKIGLAYGPVMRLTVGEAQYGLKSVLVGPGVDKATIAEQHALQGEVVASLATLELLDTPPPIRTVRDTFAVIAGEVAGA
jgi:class 3 adenylate cyclase